MKHAVNQKQKLSDSKLVSQLEKLPSKFSAKLANNTKVVAAASDSPSVADQQFDT